MLFNLEYVSFLLNKNNKEEQKKFSVFRSADCIRLFKYQCGWNTGAVVTMLILLAIFRKKKLVVYFLIDALPFIIGWLLEYYRKRWSVERQIKILFVYFAVSQVYIVLAYDLLHSLYEENYVIAFIVRIYATYAIAVQFIAPKLTHMIFYSFVFAIVYTYIVTRHVVLAPQAFVMGFVALITLSFVWYIQQDIAFTNFTQQEELERREQMAVLKEQQMRKILNLQQDGIVIFNPDLDQ